MVHTMEFKVFNCITTLNKSQFICNYNFTFKNSNNENHKFYVGKNNDPVKI